MGVRDESPLYDEVPGLADQGFLAAVASLKEIKLQMAALEVQEKQLTQELEAMLIVSDQKRVRWEGFCVERSGGRSPAKIDAQLLIAKGVAVADINECTIPGTPYTYIQLIDLSKKQKGGAPATADGDA